jgi:hypothetical protein
VDPATYRALLEVPTSLGLLAGDPSSRAFAYLRDGTSLEAWQGKGLRWTSPSLRDEDRAVLMVRRSITGLGLSGSEAAREHLRGMERSPDYSRLRQYVEHNVTEAIQMSERIESLGVQRVLDEEIQRSEEGQQRQERQ